MEDLVGNAHQGVVNFEQRNPHSILRDGTAVDNRPTQNFADPNVKATSFNSIGNVVKVLDPPLIAHAAPVPHYYEVDANGR
jgi:hypothetical protein